MTTDTWTLEEANRLVKLAKADTPSSSISMILGRPREEVDSKMMELALHRTLKDVSSGAQMPDRDRTGRT